MKCSEATNEISAALAKAQGIINSPGKNSINPHFRNKYADLSAGLNAVRDGLSANGIATIQSTRMDGEVLMLDTRLAHASGQWFEAEWPVSKLPAPPQQIGSALTYARRYSLFSIVGIAGEEDDDGNAAQSATPAPPVLVDLDQIAHLEQLIRDTGSDVAAFLKAMKASSVDALTVEQYKTALGLFARKRAQMDAAK